MIRQTCPYCEGQQNARDDSMGCTIVCKTCEHELVESKQGDFMNIDNMIYRNYSGEYRSYALMLRIADYQVDESQRRIDDSAQGGGVDDGSGLFSVAAIVFYAFAIEAFVDHVGRKIFSDWEKEYENKPRVKKTIAVLEKLIPKSTLDDDENQFLGNLFDYRDNISHGQTQIISSKKRPVLSPKTHPDLISNSLKLSTAINFQTNVHRFIEKILTLIGEDPFQRHSEFTGSGWATPRKNRKPKK